MKLNDLLKHLTEQGLCVCLCYDINKKEFYIDLNTQAKSHLCLYESGMLCGRYNYETQIDLKSNAESITISLCYEFLQALCGRDYGSNEWFELCKQKGIKVNN